MDEIEENNVHALADRIADLAEKHGISSTRIALKLGITNNLAKDYLCGDLPIPTDHLSKIGLLLKTRVSVLTGAEDQAVTAEIGQMIADRRRHLEINQDTLATTIGVSRSSLANMERGARPISVALLASICKELRMDVPAIVSSTNAPKGADLEKKLLSLFRPLSDEQKRLAIDLISVVSERNAG